MNRTVCVRARTRLLVWAVVLAAAPTSVRPGAASAPAQEHHGGGPSLTAKEALDRLMEGNQRFVAGRPQRPHQTTEWRSGLLAGQHPIAAVLGCSDSRVPIEELFDQGFGDLFVVRVAGNVADVDERGSVEYAVAHLGVPLVLVVGHERCGAVTAALAPAAERRGEAPEVQALLARIEPALKGLGPSPGSDRVLLGVESNARFSLGQLLHTPLLEQRVAKGQLQIKAGVYELATGRVRLLD